MKRVAMVFPGQGSQAVGMLAALHASDAATRETFAAASSILGYDLWDLVANGPAAALNSTEKTQPAMFVSGVACYLAWHDAGGPDAFVMAGHSLGEYTALCCAGVLDFDDAVKLVAERGRLMQSAVPERQGAMAALIGLGDDVAIELCAAAAEGQVLQAVNFNAPGQVVIAGHAQAVQRAIEQAKQAGAKRAVVLPVTVPSHCDLMRPAAAALLEVMQDITFKAPRLPVIHNVSATTYGYAGDIPPVLARQLYRPVLWTDTMREFSLRAVSHVVELGPGKVLTGLTKRIDKSMTALPVFDPDSMRRAIAEVLE